MSKTVNISKQVVFEAWKLVKKNRGTYGIDKQSLSDFESDLKNQLYKIWNRLCSGSYFPPPVRKVEIPKRDGKKRGLGIPTVGDRVAQGAIKILLEPRFEQVFHQDSYGYRPGRSCHKAIAVTRERCWKYGWIVEYDIRGLFDNIPHDLLLKAIKIHCEEKWIITYVERWLKAPVMDGSEVLAQKERGTPQGGVLSPLLSNIFMHYAMDMWMQKQFCELPWVRYCDDGLVHCMSYKQAKYVKDLLSKRMNSLGLELHPDKTKIIHCSDDRRPKLPGKHENSFTFLGYEFKSRIAVNRFTKERFLRFLPAIGNSRLKELRSKIKAQSVLRAMYAKIDDLAQALNPLIRGWIQYYGKFYPSRLNGLYVYINERLMIWIKHKYNRGKLGGTRNRAYKTLRRIYHARPKLFAHWNYGLSTF